MANGCEQKLHAPLWSIEASAGGSPFFFFQLLVRCPSRGTEPGPLDNYKGRSLKGQEHLHRLRNTQEVNSLENPKDGGTW